MYIYIYIYIFREREREREKEWALRKTLQKEHAQHIQVLRGVVTVAPEKQTATATGTSCGSWPWKVLDSSSLKQSKMKVSWNWVHFDGIFYYKPSILGYQHLWKLPHWKDQAIHLLHSIKLWVTLGGSPSTSDPPIVYGHRSIMFSS